MTQHKSASAQMIPSREALQQDVAEVLLTVANQARFAFFDASRDTDVHLWHLLTGRNEARAGDLADPDLSPRDLRIGWSDVAGTALGATIMQMYDFGVLALSDVTGEDLDHNEGSAAWVSRLLSDLQRSFFLLEWNEATGGRATPSVERCLAVAEMADARVLLEDGDECFFPDSTPGLLTFRQLALLSGMTEASLRTIASRASGGLQTERRGNNTYIQVGHAKQWLKARNRYTPVRRVSNAGALPLTSRRYANVDEFTGALDDRLSYLVGELGSEVMQQRLQGTPWEEPEQSPSGLHVVGVTTEQLMDRGLMQRLAKALELPVQMFVLRAAETVHSEALRRIEQELQGAKE